MIKRFVAIVAVALVVFGAIFGYKYHSLQKAKAAAASRKPAPASVTSAEVVQDTWRTTLSAVGDVQSSQGITVRAEIEGRVVSLGFDSGAPVEAGALLVQLDSATEEAQLRALQARAELTQLTLQRQRELQEKQTNTQADLDAAEAAAAEAAAGVEGVRAVLAKKKIVAPFSGRLGLRQVNIGQFINKGDPIVALEALNPIYVDFGLPQQATAQLRPDQEVQVTVDTFPGRVFSGRIQAISPRVVSDTRSVLVRAVLPNEDEALRPGMFARAEVLLPDERSVAVLPSTAIVYSPYGDSVYVVAEQRAEGDSSPRLTVQQRFVKIGPKRGDLVAIESGVKAGERVVTSGQIKLRSGAPVQINNTVVPANSANPKPSES